MDLGFATNAACPSCGRRWRRRRRTRRCFNGPAGNLHRETFRGWEDLHATVGCENGSAHQVERKGENFVGAASRVTATAPSGCLFANLNLTETRAHRQHESPTCGRRPAPARSVPTLRAKAFHAQRSGPHPGTH